jgi:hypothetical protein
VPAFFGSPAAANLLLPLDAACWAGNRITSRRASSRDTPQQPSRARDAGRGSCSTTSVGFVLILTV